MKRKFYQLAAISMCSLLAACSSVSDSWQSVRYSSAADKDRSIAYLRKQPVTSEWMNVKEAQLRESIKGTQFTLHQQDNTWIVTAPVQMSFNPDRPTLLLPSALRPITRISKMLEANPDTAVLILGHTDVVTNSKGSYTLSADRARAVASIFRLSGLTGRRMTHLGLGDSHTLSNTKYAAQNNRVEIIITPSTHMQDVAAVYRPAHARQLALAETR